MTLDKGPNEVWRGGRDLEAEVIRSMLEAYGIPAEVWTSGMGKYSTPGALTEISGAPNDFGHYRVMVAPRHEEEARALIASFDEDAQPEPE